MTWGLGNARRSKARWAVTEPGHGRREAVSSDTARPAPGRNVVGPIRSAAVMARPATGWPGVARRVTVRPVVAAVLGAAMLDCSAAVAAPVPGLVAAPDARSGAVPGAAAGAAPGDQAPGETLRIMPLGDSITRGTGTPGLGSYRDDLAMHLSGAGLRMDFVGSQRNGMSADRDHEGHGGAAIEELGEKVDGWLDEYEPDVILLHAGTNNVTRGEDAATILAKLDVLLDQVRAARPEAYVFVAQIILSRVPEEAETAQVYNALIPALVARRQDSRMFVVDQSSVTGIDLHDLRHPDQFGYEKMAWNWYQALARTFPLPIESGPNPYLMTETRRCLAQKVVVDGEVKHRTECRTWVLRDQPDGSRQWQTLRRRVVTVDGEPRVVEYWTGPGDLLNV
ncbi:SGNH/GDSL hydrolase family protein [Symbioplanes lichenis]|uniref:SGNH/GDSL hydrolase family protein n=1 Tax=Symbioplanes lichenis TaxID=1629072 RepID=UPI00273A42AA|nr:SGNH/GDSL hydrolase family protein [Actinoplanes lichenis]